MTMTVPLTPVTEPRTSDYGRLIISGQDRPGIVQAVSTVLAEAGANIVSLDQYSTDPRYGRYFQRTVFQLPALAANLPALEKELDREVGDKLGLSWRLAESARRKRVAIFASKTEAHRPKNGEGQHPQPADSSPQVLPCLARPARFPAKYLNNAGP
jgi:formyltetrahydrofolate deformylase